MIIAAQWQWSRYKYKVLLLQSFRLNSLTMPLSFPPAQNSERILPDAESIIEKRVKLSGIYDYSRQVIITNREGQIGAFAGPGHLLITPFKLTDGSNRTVLVSRGFVPFADRDPDTWEKYSFDKGEVTIEAVAQRSITPSRFGPKNKPIDASNKSAFQRIWFFEEIESMAKQLPYPILENIYLQKLGGPPTGEFPREAVKIQVPPSTHLGYTIEWSLLAVLSWVIAIFLQSYSWRRRAPASTRLPLKAPAMPLQVSALLSAVWVISHVFSPSPVFAVEDPGRLLTETGIVQHLGKQVDLELRFAGTDGVVRPLREIVVPGKPILIAPVYYRCPRLCTLTLNGLVKALNLLELKLGSDFTVLTFSINPKETPALATEKSALYHAEVAKKQPDTAAFRFLTGDADAIRQLTSQLGFIYQQDGNDFAHTPGIMVITPQGQISRYFLGVEYPESELRYALVEAGGGAVGGLAEQIFLYCFRFDPTKGKYTPAAWNLMRIASVLCVILLGAFLAYLWFEPKRLWLPKRLWHREYLSGEGNSDETRSVGIRVQSSEHTDNESHRL